VAKSAKISIENPREILSPLCSQLTTPPDDRMSFFSWLGLSLLLLLCTGQLLLAADLGGNVAATGEGPANHNAAADLEGMTDSLALWLQQVWEAAQVHLEAAVQAIRYRKPVFLFGMRVEEGLKPRLRLLRRIWFYPLSPPVIIAGTEDKASVFLLHRKQKQLEKGNSIFGCVS
jgi:hypothetical protein